jgi:tetratricopeptide (TPR) repeat protein
MFPRAIAQLQRALALEPNDAETHQALIVCYDKLQDREGAVRQILQLVELTRRDIAQFKNLGERFITLERPRDAERAYTSIIEALPTESESHALLAEIRQTQERWPEAIEQWGEAARLRALEPTGLLRLAGAQIHEKQWPAARETLRKLNSTSWPPRFGDVRNQVRELERQINAAKDR